MDARDLAWLAGLLEGEGCFIANKRSPGCPNVRLYMTDRDVVERAATLMGSEVRERKYMVNIPSRQMTYGCSLSGEAAYALMSALLPHMGARRAGKIKELLDVRDSMRGLIRANGRARFDTKPHQRSAQ